MRPQCTCELIRKLLGRHKDGPQLRMQTTDFAVDAFGQMSLPGPNTAVQKQRAVPLARLLADLLCRRRRKLAAWSGDEFRQVAKASRFLSTSGADGTCCRRA